MTRRLIVLLLAAVAGAATAILATLPSQAAGTSPPNSASFTAVDFGWDAAGGGNSATIAQGGTVSFGYPSGASQHNADFGSGLHPSSCSQTAGTSSGAVPPLPHNPTSPGWSGTCTFNTPGTYTFHCDLHAFMTATIVVQGSGTTTGTTTTTPPTTGTTTTPPTTGTTTTPPTTTTTTTPRTTTTSTTTTSTRTTSPPGTTSPASSGAPGSPVSAPAGSPPTVGARQIVIAAVQHGPVVRGSLRISSADAHGRLEVDLFVPAVQLARGRHDPPVRVGRLIRRPPPAGLLRFAVPLNSTARAALRRRGRLELTVRISLLAAAGRRVSFSRQVLLKL
jgi:plastocyanin